MQLAAATTVWICFSLFLILPHLGAPRLLPRAAMMLLCLEMLALMIWTYGSEDCIARPCGSVPETARTAAALDVPALTGVLVALSIAVGLRRARR
jgi:hypothetical protein